MEKLWYHLLYGDFFKNERGLKSFVLQRNQLALDAIDKKTGIKVNSKKLNKHQDASDYADVSIPDHIYKEKKRKLRIYSAILILAIIAELVLNYIATMIFLEGTDLIILIFRVAITIVLTAASILVADKLFEAIFINDKFRDTEIFNLPEAKEGFSFGYNGSNGFEGINMHDEWLKHKKRSYTNKIPLLLFFMLILEFAIVAIADVRAKDFEGERWTLLYLGFVIFAMGLPLIAGFIKMELDRDRVVVDAYRRNRFFKTAKEDAAKFTEELPVISEEKFKKILRKEARRQFSKIHKFKTFKENVDLRRGREVEMLDEIEYIENLESYTYFLYTNTNIAEYWDEANIFN